MKVAQKLILISRKGLIFVICCDKILYENKITLIKSGGGTGPVKPGNLY